MADPRAASPAPSAPLTRLPSQASAPSSHSALSSTESGDFSWKYWAFRIAGALASVVPLWLARPLTAAGGWVAWALVWPLRRRAEWNMGHIPALAADPAKRRRAARQAFVGLALNYLDFFRGRRVTSEELARGWDIQGWDGFKRALALGKGMIVVGAHYGPFEYAAWKLGAEGHPIITPAERLKPERLHHLVSVMRNHHGARIIAGDERETLREMIAALRRGDIIVFAVDRWVMGPKTPWPLFGAPAELPTAPFALAARSDAPVFLMAPRRAGLNHFTGVIEPLTPERIDSSLAMAASAPTERGGDREEAVARMRARVYPAIERLISEDPGQWVSALSTVWGAPASPSDGERDAS